MKITRTCKTTTTTSKTMSSSICDVDVEDNNHDPSSSIKLSKSKTESSSSSSSLHQQNNHQQKKKISSPVVTSILQYFEWGGQTVASLMWIISVFVYGIESLGDILQLMAALSWFLANIATLILALDD